MFVGRGRGGWKLRLRVIEISIIEVGYLPSFRLWLSGFFSLSDAALSHDNGSI